MAGGRTASPAPGATGTPCSTGRSRRPRTAWLGRAGAVQDGVEEAGEAQVELFATQRVKARRPLESLADHAGLAQDAEVVGAGRLGDGKLKALARARLARGEAAHDLQPHGVAQRMKH